MTVTFTLSNRWCITHVVTLKPINSYLRPQIAMIAGEYRIVHQINLQAVAFGPCRLFTDIVVDNMLIVDGTSQQIGEIFDRIRKAIMEGTGIAAAQGSTLIIQTDQQRVVPIAFNVQSGATS